MVMIARLLDDPLAALDRGRLAGVELADEGRVVVGGTAFDPGRALLDRVGEDAGVDVGDLGSRVMMERELRPRLDRDPGGRR